MKDDVVEVETTEDGRKKLLIEPATATVPMDVVVTSDGETVKVRNKPGPKPKSSKGETETITTADGKEKKVRKPRGTAKKESTGTTRKRNTKGKDQQSQQPPVSVAAPVDDTDNDNGSATSLSEESEDEWVDTIQEEMDDSIPAPAAVPAAPTAAAIKQPSNKRGRSEDYSDNAISPASTKKHRTLVHPSRLEQ